MTDDLRGLAPQHPVLYALEPDGRSLAFFYAKCPACARLSFPANVPGCAHCGTSLKGAETISRPGEGTLLEFVTLHVPLKPGMQTPRIAGDIRLADGWIEEGVIGVPSEADLRVGMTLRAVAEPLPDGAHFGCRFVPADGAGAA